MKTKLYLNFEPGVVVVDVVEVFKVF